MEPVFRFSIKASLNPTLTMGSLRNLDLGGNALSDSAVGSLLRSLASPECSLASLYLNDNVWALGRETADALLGQSTISAAKQAKVCLFCLFHFKPEKQTLQRKAHTLRGKMENRGRPGLERMACWPFHHFVVYPWPGRTYPRKVPVEFCTQWRRKSKVPTRLLCLLF